MITVDANKNITMTRGDTFHGKLTLKKDNVAYTPQEGDVVRFALAHRYKGENGYKLILTKVIQFDGANGTFTIDSYETAGLKYGTYQYDIEVVYADGTVETFANEKKFILTKEVA